jgi:hypothetical protein
MRIEVRKVGRVAHSLAWLTRLSSRLREERKIILRFPDIALAPPKCTDQDGEAA